MKKILFILLLIPAFGNSQLISFFYNGDTLKTRNPLTGITSPIVTSSPNTFSIGTVNSTAPLTIANTNLVPPAPQAGTQLQAIGYTTPARFVLDSYRETANGSAIQGRAATGTPDAPGATATDQVLLAINGDGYGTSSYTGSGIASVTMRAEAGFTNTSKPTYIEWTTTPSGSVTQVARMRMKSTGVLNIAGLSSAGFMYNAAGGDVTSIDAATARINLGLGTLSTQSGTFSGTSSGTNTGDNAANTTYANDYRAANFVAGTNYLAPTGNGSALTGITQSQVSGLVTDLSNKQPLNTNLTSIAGLANGNGFLKNNGSGTFTYESPAGSGTVTNVTATNNTGQTWTITNPTSTPNLSLALTPAAVGKQYVKLASNFSSTSVTETSVTGWSFAVTSGKEYEIEVRGMYQTAATTTGGELGFFLSGGATGTIGGNFEGAVVSTAAASALMQGCTAIGAADLAGSNMITTGVTAINSPHYIKAKVFFVCTVSGTFNVGWATEVAASAAQLNANTSVLIYTQLN